MKKLVAILAFLVVNGLSIIAQAQTFNNPLCPNGGSGTKTCVGALAEVKGGFGQDVSTGLTNNQVAVVAGGAITIGPLPAVAVPNLAGDVTGNIAANTVIKVQGTPWSATAPTTNQIPQLIGGVWTPSTITALLYSLVSDVAATPCQVANSVTATDHVTLPSGGTSGFVDNAIGIYAATVAMAGTASIAPIGARITGCTIATPGPQFVSTTGSLVPFASLVSGNFTRQMAICTATVCYVQILDSFQVP